MTSWIDTDEHVLRPGFDERLAHQHHGEVVERCVARADQPPRDQDASVQRQLDGAD